MKMVRSALLRRSYVQRRNEQAMHALVERKNTWLTPVRMLSSNEANTTGVRLPTGNEPLSREIAYEDDEPRCP